MDRRVDAAGLHGLFGQRAERFDAFGQQILQKRPDQEKGQEKDQPHDENKHRDGGIFPRQDAVDALAALVLAALARLDDARPTNLFDIIKAHIRDGGAAVKAALGLHLQDDMLQHFLFVLIEFKLCQDLFISLDQLARRKAGGQRGALGVVLDEMPHGVQRAVHRAAVVLDAAKVLPQRRFLVARDVHGMTHQLVHALVLRRRDRHDRHAQHALHRVDVHRAAVAGQLVHHVQRHDHRHVHLQQLHRQIQIALDVRRVDDVDDGLGLSLQHEIARDELLARIRRHRIDARQVGDQRVLLPADLAVLAVDRHAGEIAHVLVGAGQLVKERRLTAVLVADERKAQQRAVRQRLARALGVELSFFAETRVIRGLPLRPLRALVGNALDPRDRDLFRVGKTQRQLIAVDAQLHRVAHRRKLDHRRLRAGDDPHVQKMLPQGAFAAHGFDASGLTRAQLAHFHILFTPRFYRPPRALSFPRAAVFSSLCVTTMCISSLSRLPKARRLAFRPLPS